MRIAITPVDYDLTRKKLAALPAGLQSDVYGYGLFAAAKKAARRAKILVLPRGDSPPLTSKGKPRRHLQNSIRAVQVSWHWAGEKVKRSAAIIIAEQPHAHLIELGTVHWSEGPRPFLAPALKDSASLLEGFRVGSARRFDRLVKRLERGKLTARERKFFNKPVYK